MDKEAFLLGLRQALTGNLPADVVDSHIEYYRDYINSKIRMGESEQDVVASLGNPRLIARSILEVSDTAYQRAEYQQSTDYSEQESSSQFKSWKKKMPGWLKSLIVFLVVILVINLLFRLAFSLLPVFLPILLILLVVKFFRDWL